MKTLLTRILTVTLAVIVIQAWQGHAQTEVVTLPDLAGSPTVHFPESGERSYQILVKPKSRPGVAVARMMGDVDRVHARHGGKVKKTFPRIGNLQLVELPKGVSVNEMLAKYRNNPEIEYAEPDFSFTLHATPNDPKYNDATLWGLNNTGASGGVAGADIQAVDAWNIRSSASSVIVAVLDTGVRYTHQDLAANMWVNPGEVAGNGIDDDGNGIVDDVHGINAVPLVDTGDPMDLHGHGTHVAGTIGAVGNNNLGGVGVAWNVKIMACRIAVTGGAYDNLISSIISAVNYAIAKGANIINASWGFPAYSQAVRDAILSARNAGIIFVNSAGNDNFSLDRYPSYPAMYDLDNIVTVAATDRQDHLAYFSTFGESFVDIAAPGHEIYSTYYSSDSAYAIQSGTSMAAPHVVGALALLKAQAPSETYLQLIYRLFAGVEPIYEMRGKVRTAGRLNIFNALNSTLQSALANNTFTTRAEIAGLPASAFGVNLGASKESGESNHAGNSGGKSIWWKWIAPNSGKVTITTSRSEIDTLLAVYTGAAVNGLTLVAANDDSGLVSDGLTTSQLSFDAVGNVEYQIVVDGKNGAAGAIALQLSATPANDSFANAARLATDFVGAETSNFGASKELGEPNHAGIAGGRSLWWRWRAPASGVFSIATTESVFDSVIAVYTGAAVSSLTLIASNDNGPYGGVGDRTAKVDFNAVAGTDYSIAIDGKDGAAGTLILAGGFRYTLTELDSDPTFGYKWATAINNGNKLGGHHYRSIPSGNVREYAETWELGLWTDLGLGIGTLGTGVNSFGNTVGDKITYDDPNSGILINSRKPYIWTAGAGYFQLFNDYLYANAEALNDYNEVAGSLDLLVTPPKYRAYFWNATLGRIEAGNMGGASSQAESINNDGWLVGRAENGSTLSGIPTQRGFLWKPGGALQDLGGFFPSQSANRGSEASDINNVGQIVGNSHYSAGGLRHAYRRSGAQVVQDLGALPSNIPSGSSFAKAANNYGAVVGSSGFYIATGSLGHSHGFLAQYNRPMIDLNHLIVQPTTISGYPIVMSNGRDINDLGSIVCDSLTPPAGTFSYLLTDAVSKLRLISGARGTNGHFSFAVTGPNGSCLIEASSDLNSWSSVSTITIVSGSANFSDAGAAALGARYYRASVGAVKSINALGFKTKTIPQGSSLIANPLYAKDNRVPALFNGVLGITECLKWSPKDYNWASSTKSNGVWSDTQLAIYPGEGAWVNASSASTITFIGEVMQGQLHQEISAGSALVGAFLPIGGSIESTLGYTPKYEDYVAKWTGSTWKTYVFDGTQWWDELGPAALTLAEGEAVFPQLFQSSRMEKYYSVW